MARKSPWEQFANNFTTFYDLGNKIQTDRESKKIMEEEPVVQATGLGQGPHSVYQASYGGKTYNQQITPEMLRGLQYDRLGDVKAKFGDQEGAMSMREKAAGIRNQQASLQATNLSNELAQKTLDFNVEQAKLKIDSMGLDIQKQEQVLKEMVANMPLDLARKALVNFGYHIDNNRNIIKLEVEKETKKAEIELKNLEVDAKKVEIANQKLLGKGYKIDNDGNLVQLGVDRATAKNRITKSRLDVNEQQQKIINDALIGSGLVWDNKLKQVKAVTAERTQASEIGATNAINAASQSEAKLEENSNQTLLEYSKMVKAGKFKDGGGVSWLKENWTGDQATLDVINNMQDHEVDNIMREGALMIKKVEASMTGKTAAESIPVLQELMDGQDGIPGNLEIKQGEGGSIFLIEEDENGDKNTTIMGKNWKDFQANLLGTLTPLKSIEIAQAAANVQKTQAEAAQLSNLGLDPDQVSRDWNAQRLQIIKTAQENNQPIPSAVDMDRLRTEWINGMITRAGAGLQASPTNTQGYVFERID